MESSSYKLILSILGVYLLVTCKTVYANQCGGVFEDSVRPATTISGAMAFDPRFIDPVLKIPKSRAKSLRDSKVLDFIEGIVDPRNEENIPLSRARSFLETLKQHLDGVNDSDVATRQEINFKKLQFLIDKQGPIVEDPSQAIYLNDLKKQVKYWLSESDSSVIPRDQLNRLAIANSFVMAHKNGKTRPQLNGNYQIKGKGISENFFIANNLLSCFPTFYAFHPETTLFLISRGLYTWSIAEKLGSLDGHSNLEPYEQSLHDSGHFGPIRGANSDISVAESSNTFDLIWTQYLNKKPQTWREREIAVHLIFDAFFESAEKFTLRELNTHLEKLSQNQNGYLDYMITILNSPIHFGSRLIHERPVTKEELSDATDELLSWIKKVSHP